MTAPLLESEIPGIFPHRGKVRDVYDLGDRVVLVATDRISAFDWILPTAIPDKGRVLTQISQYWFKHLIEPLGVRHHLISTDVTEMDLPEGTDLDALAGRTMLCRKSQVVPFECVARGYLAGSGWKEYQADQSVCGVMLEGGLLESSKLNQPIFTPATKAEQGDHDENIVIGRMEEILGNEFAHRLRDLTLKIYQQGATKALECGVIIADTKFEFGLAADDGSEELLLIDEILTPDSSRFWPADQYEPGCSQQSFDKQFVRDWLLASDWDRQSEPPALPEEIVSQTRAKYVEAYEKITGQAFAWI